MTLRSADVGPARLSLPLRATSTNFGDRAFAVSGPMAWNELPAEVKKEGDREKFKRKLKTHLFQQSYPEQGPLRLNLN